MVSGPFSTADETEYNALLSQARTVKPGLAHVDNFYLAESNPGLIRKYLDTAKRHRHPYASPLHHQPHDLRIADRLDPGREGPGGASAGQDAAGGTLPGQARAVNDLTGA